MSLGMGENVLSEVNAELHSSHLWRENTIVAFMQAYKRGARFVEMDIQVISDSSLILTFV